MNALRQALARAAAELRSNGRLRAGLWLIAGLLLAFGLTIQADRLAEAAAGHAQETRLLAGVQSALERRDWPELLAQEEEINAELATGFWQADTEGLAQAQLQQALRDLAERLELRNPRIRAGLTRAVPEMPGVCQVQARFRAQYRPGGELRLLYALATSERKLVAEQLNLNRRNTIITTIVSAYFLGLEAAGCGAEDDD